MSYLKKDRHPRGSEDSDVVIGDPENTWIPLKAYGNDIYERYSSATLSHFAMRLSGYYFLHFFK